MKSKLFFKLRYLPVVLCALAAAPIAQAATTPGLGMATTYGVLSNTYTNTVIGTTINGDVGFTTGPAVAPAGTHTNYGSGAPYATAGSDQNAALVALSAQPCDFVFGSATDLSLLSQPLSPGVYCINGATSIGTGGITLTAGGTYIFRTVGALTSVANATVNLGGASACDVFWTPTAATTLGANTNFAGTIIGDAGITLGANTIWNGRALAFGGTITTATDTITVPVCLVPVLPPAPLTSGPQVAPLINIRKVPSPLALPAGPGSVTYTYKVTNPGQIPIHDVTLTDDKCSNVKFISGDTNNDSLLDLTETWTYSCTTTLTVTTVNYATVKGTGNGMAAVDTAIAEVIVGVPVVPPLINVIKTPSPLNLPFGGGSVLYSYTVTNPGTVALSNVTLTDDKCANVIFVSGDGNSDNKLQPAETWKYTCTSTIPLTTTNTAIATGHANGLTAVDTALATVVVAGSPIPPPLIHIIKKADPVILPAGGGTVSYTYAVTNPGTIGLSDVSVQDDKCTPVNLLMGDLNNNNLLDTNETWTYVCQQHIGTTTTNTATATGHANGLTVNDISVANVVVSPALIPPPPKPAPKLPNTGYAPLASSATWLVMLSALFVGGTLLFAISKRKNLS